jgi:two-component system phosphate regulon sensor histidine kinase PhoR
VQCRALDTEVIVDVTDEGIGISAKHLPRLFERFYRVDKARSRKLGGTGLGLAIVKHIVQVHGGRVEVRSVPHNGSTFTLHIPMVQNRSRTGPSAGEASE